MRTLNFAGRDKIPCLWLTGSLLILAASATQAATATYTLDNVILADHTQITGTFSWTYATDDFENGVGQFTYLSIPHTTHDQTDLDATIDVGQSIEITLPGSSHDDGVDITLVLVQALTPESGAAIDLIESKYEIGGNGFHDGLFLSGIISPVVDSDADGVADNADNCIQVVNPDQRDTDGDGIGNICDADLDNDCTVNFVDLGQMKAVFFTSDPNADLNGDGDVNFLDLGILRLGFFKPPGPGAMPNGCDLTAGG